jgi:hypothetical protein
LAADQKPSIEVEVRRFIQATGVPASSSAAVNRCIAAGR